MIQLLVPHRIFCIGVGGVNCDNGEGGSVLGKKNRVLRGFGAIVQRNSLLCLQGYSGMFVITVNGEVKKEAFTSLKGACESAGVDYFVASRGRRVFKVLENEIVIAEVELVKIKGRGNKNMR